MGTLGQRKLLDIPLSIIALSLLGSQCLNNREKDPYGFL